MNNTQAYWQGTFDRVLRNALRSMASPTDARAWATKVADIALAKQRQDEVHRTTAEQYRRASKGF